MTGQAYNLASVMADKKAWVKELSCPFCYARNFVPWKTPTETGYLDQSFAYMCSKCQKNIDKAALERTQLERDCADHLAHGTPLRGTLLTSDGLPTPNAPGLMQRLRASVFGETEEDMPTKILVEFDTASLSSTSISRPPGRSAGAASASTPDPIIRDILSGYTGNPTLGFSRNLYAAVHMHLNFLDTAPDLTWVHLPTAAGRMKLAIQRYSQFISLAYWHPKASMFPPWDIDLVWRTHQLYPSAYFDFCLAQLGRVLPYSNVGVAPSADPESVSRATKEAEELWERAYGTEFTIM